MSATNSGNLIGNLVRDLEIRQVGEVRVGKTTIANNRYYKRDGETQQKTNFIDLEFWGKSLERIENLVHKGSLVSVEYELRQDEWEKDGQKRSKVFCVVSDCQILNKKKEKVEATTEVVESPEVTTEQVPF